MLDNGCKFEQQQPKQRIQYSNNASLSEREHLVGQSFDRLHWLRTIEKYSGKKSNAKEKDTPMRGVPNTSTYNVWRMAYAIRIEWITTVSRAGVVIDLVLIEH